MFKSAICQPTTNRPPNPVDPNPASVSSTKAWAVDEMWLGVGPAARGGESGEAEVLGRRGSIHGATSSAGHGCCRRNSSLVSPIQ